MEVGFDELDVGEDAACVAEDRDRKERLSLANRKSGPQEGRLPESDAASLEEHVECQFRKSVLSRIEVAASEIDQRFEIKHR
jgi:hypothetical protein